MDRIVISLRRFLSSIQLTVSLLFMLFSLILFATFAQVDYGIFEANERYFMTWFVWMESIPIFLGGYSLGTLMVINLLLSHATRFKWQRRYLGLFLIHFGLIVLIVGSGITRLLGHEMQIAIKEGQTIQHVLFPSQFELVVIDTGAQPGRDLVYSHSLAALAQGISFQSWHIQSTQQLDNAIINQRGIPSLRFDQLGQWYKLIGLPKTYEMDKRNVPGLVVTVTTPDHHQRLILWGGSAVYQTLDADGRYVINLRPKRTYLPFSIRLNDFIKDNYQGTKTAKRFVSNVTVTTPEGSVPFTIQMNQPLRFNGYTFFQSSFTEDEATSVFQVVKNPSWLAPYIASLLITAGLFLQMIEGIRKGRRRS